MSSKKTYNLPIPVKFDPSLTIGELIDNANEVVTKQNSKRLENGEIRIETDISMYTDECVMRFAVVQKKPQ